MVITNREKYIYYLSELYVGSSHDFGIFKEEFPGHINWFADKKVIVDLGFIGVEDRYKIKELLIPYKKTKEDEKQP